MDNLREDYIKSLEGFLIKVALRFNTLPDFTDPKNGNEHLFKKIDEIEKQIDSYKEICSEYIPSDKLDEANKAVILLIKGDVESIGRELLNKKES